MGYFIRNTETKKYFAQYSDLIHKRWVDNIDQAYTWRKKQSAENVANTTLKGFLNGAKIEIGNIEDITIEATAETTIVATTEPDKVENGLTPEQIELDIIALCTAVPALADTFSHIPLLIEYCKNELSKHDRMEQDILHKIEFDEIHPLVAVRLCKQLKEIRLKRREIKNRITYLSTLNSKEVTSLGTKAISILEHFDKLIYIPRELPELFGGNNNV